MREWKRKGRGPSRVIAIDGVRWEEIERDALELYLGISRLMSHFHGPHRPAEMPAARTGKKRP